METDNRLDFKEEERRLVSQVLKTLKGIRFGYIQIIVHDSKAIQIDKVEKIRLDKE